MQKILFLFWWSSSYFHLKSLFRGAIIQSLVYHVSYLKQATALPRVFSLLPPHQEDLVFPCWASVSIPGAFHGRWHWSNPEGISVENVYYVQHESHSSLRNPAQPSFLSSCYLVMNKGEAQTSLPHSEQFRTTYRFQSCSGLKLGAECIICTCPETIIDKHLPDTA